MFGLLRFFVEIDMSGYPPPFVTVPAEIEEVFRTWGYHDNATVLGSGSPIAELCPMGVREMFDSQGCW